MVQLVGINVSGNGCKVHNSQVFGSSVIAQGSVNFIFHSGINIEGSTFTVADCQVSGIVTTNVTTTPFPIYTHAISVYNASNGSVVRCQLSDGVTNGPIVPSPAVYVTTGLDVARSSDIIVEECNASSFSQSAVNPIGKYSVASGYRFGPIERLIVRQCVATNITDTMSGLSFGFSTTDPYASGNAADVVFESCIAEAVLANGGIGGGFELRSTTASKILYCEAARNTIGIYVTENNAEDSYDNLISDNTLLENLYAGIFDSTALNANAYFSNRADGNGATPSVTNYLGSIFPTTPFCYSSLQKKGRCQSLNTTPIRLWQLPGAPCATNTNCQGGDELDNISIFR